MNKEVTILRTSRKGIEIEVIENEVSGVKWKIDTTKHDKQIREDAITELKSLLRCRNYRGCAAGKGCDGVCSIDSDICKSCENFGIPYSLFEQMQKGAEE